MARWRPVVQRLPLFGHGLILLSVVGFGNTWRAGTATASPAHLPSPGLDGLRSATATTATSHSTATDRRAPTSNCSRTSHPAGRASAPVTRPRHRQRGRRQPGESLPRLDLDARLLPARLCSSHLAAHQDRAS